MDCKKPIKVRGITVGCGQCLPCRINKRREWTHRIMLEAKTHAKNCFITLTYSPENYPKDGSLVPEDLQKYLKRLRKAVAPSKVRYFAVGEYGDRSDRPHFHIACFGLGMDDADVIDSCWGYGFTYTGTLTLDSAQYVAGYVTKKMTKKDDPRLNGRYPEFSRMSLRPAIGVPALKFITDALDGKFGSHILSNFNDVPKVLKVGNKSMPLGRTLTDKLRDHMNWERSINGREYPKEILEARQQKAFETHLQLVQEAEANPEKAKPLAKLATQRQKALNRETRHEIYNKRSI